MKITILGSGTSQGVPVITCKCDVCLSNDNKDKRLRSSILIELENLTIVVDTGPDFRQQMLRENVQKLDAILYTHEHKDHTAGLDDVRAFNFKQKKDMPIYAEQIVQDSLKREFYYAFSENKYPGTPSLKLNLIDNTPFKIKQHHIIPIRGLHYKLPVLGFRINNFCYITDMNDISNTELEKIKGCEVLVINGLRKEKHLSHFNLQEALEIIKISNVKIAYITHISHLLGKHIDIEKELPKNVFLAFDGLKIKMA